MRDTYSYQHDLEVPHFDENMPVAVMDAECVLCSWGAQMIHRLDHSRKRFVSARSRPRLGRRCCVTMGWRRRIPPAGCLFIDDGRGHADCEAVLQLSMRLGGWARLAEVLRIFPKRLRGWLYQRVARNRYAIFGHGDMCALPDPAFQKRLFLIVTPPR